MSFAIIKSALPSAIAQSSLDTERNGKPLLLLYWFIKLNILPPFSIGNGGLLASVTLVAFPFSLLVVLFVKTGDGVGVLMDDGITGVNLE